MAKPFLKNGTVISKNRDNCSQSFNEKQIYNVANKCYDMDSLGFFKKIVKINGPVYSGKGV